MPDLVLSAADDGRALSVEAGAGITVVLGENPTTGYSWQLVGPLPACVVAEGDRYDRDAGAAIGGGGQRSFRFVATASRACDIKLELRRSWEIGLAPADRFRVGITVP